MSELVGQDASAYPQRKVTAADWLKIALRTLIGEGVEQVRILPLAKKLGVSRSSFYWYFKDREDLLNKLLDYWKEQEQRLDRFSILPGLGQHHRCADLPVRMLDRRNHL